LFIITPLLTYIFCKPEVKGSPEIAAWAKDEYKKLGSMTRSEIFMALISVLALVLWIGGSLVSLDPTMAVLGLLLAFCLLRYFFASGTAYVTAMVGLFATLILQIPGVDPAQVMLILLVPMGIMGILTPYGTGHSPIWFASGYNKGPEFWKLGAIFGIIYLAIFIVVGIPWIEFVMPLLG